MIRAGAKFIGTNADSNLPNERGWFRAGSLVKLSGVRNPTKAADDWQTRKIMEMALKRVGLTTADAVMVGDNYHTDIQAAINVGMDSLLVYTGLSRPAEVEQEEIQPTYTVATLDDWQID